MCSDSQVKQSAVVLDLTARRHLEARIWELFRGFVSDWCGYELSVALTAEATRQPQSFVRAVLTKQNVFSWMYAPAHGLG